MVYFMARWSDRLGYRRENSWITGLCYTSVALMCIGATIARRPLLPNQVFKRLQYLGISRIRPRLYRAGEQTRARHTTTAHNRQNFLPNTRGVRHANLIAVPRDNEETGSDNITLGCINARSVENKEDDISELISETTFTFCPSVKNGCHQRRRITSRRRALHQKDINCWTSQDRMEREVEWQ